MVETFNNGRLGLRATVWLHRSKSVSSGLGCYTNTLNACPVCDDNAAEGSLRANAALYRPKLILPLPIPTCLRNLALEYPCAELRRVADISTRQRLRSSSTSALTLPKTRPSVIGRFLLLLHEPGTAFYFT